MGYFAGAHALTGRGMHQEQRSAVIKKKEKILTATTCCIEIIERLIDQAGLKCPVTEAPKLSSWTLIVGH
jgi:hypothetical protein